MCRLDVSFFFGNESLGVDLCSSRVEHVVLAFVLAFVKSIGSTSAGETSVFQSTPTFLDAELTVFSVDVR